MKQTFPDFSMFEFVFDRVCFLLHWYPMECGIHQGGFLSMIKYTAFINSLLSELEQSRLCCSIYNVNTSPVGYADDIAACTLSKRKMDRVMDNVYSHSCTWRYSFNAGKRAVSIFGETQRERRIGTENRVFKLGRERVKERLHYDHVVVKTCVLGDTHFRTEEKVTKARKVLNMSTALGIKQGGLNMSTCNLIYWTVVMPTLCFGCEICVLKRKDIEQLQAFQRYAARRLQRFFSRSLNITSLVCLGWMDIITFIIARKIIFLRSIFVMNEYLPIRRILTERINDYVEGDLNAFDSPLLQILGYVSEWGIMDEIRGMANGRMLSKSGWSGLVWRKAWERENTKWMGVKVENRYLDIINMVMEVPGYSIWWMLSDV